MGSKKKGAWVERVLPKRPGNTSLGTFRLYSQSGMAVRKVDSIYSKKWEIAREHSTANHTGKQKKFNCWLGTNRDCWTEGEIHQVRRKGINLMGKGGKWVEKESEERVREGPAMRVSPSCKKK